MIKMDINSILEYCSTILGLIYILLLTKTNSVGWIFGVFSSLILVFLYATQQIYLQSLLNVYYVLIGIYAYFTWNNKKEVLLITEFNLKTHIIYNLYTIISFVLLYFFMNNVMQSNLPLIDSLVFAFSILATYLQANKILSNWIYWIFLNVISCILLYKIQLYGLIWLMLAYLMFAFYGWKQWKKIYLSKK
jgi:nicotinamide mononucleotide transporter